MTARAYRDAGFACVRPRSNVMPADLGLSAGLPRSARTLRMSHASCEEAARPSPGEISVQLYDIKWPSVRSSFVQLPFTYAAYQWARTAKTAGGRRRVRQRCHWTRERHSLSAEAARGSLRWPLPWLPLSNITLSDAEIAEISRSPRSEAETEI